MKVLTDYHTLMGFHALSILTFIMIIVNAYFATNVRNLMFNAFIWLNILFGIIAIIGLTHASWLYRISNDL
jgi:hypothetical protein